MIIKDQSKENEFWFFFNGDNVWSLYWMSYNIVSVLCFSFFSSKTCGILSPQPGIESTPPELKDEVRTTEPSRKFQAPDFFMKIF